MSFKSVLTEEQVRRAWDERNLCNRLHDPFDHALVSMCFHDRTAFAERIERLVRERLAERIKQAEGKSTNDYGLTVDELQALVRGEEER
jgi:hypothetical protein